MEEQLIEPGGDDGPEDSLQLIKTALASMEALRQSVDRKVRTLNKMSMEELKAADLSGLQRDLGKAVQQMLVEEGKANDAVRQQTDGGGLDLDAARAAIRCRLDRIRTAEGPGRVSGGVVGE